ncbi:hypothetical protein GCM10025864_36270 [Luteimicrobium album]|uniref:RuvB-like AAA+ ATPase domain-containing protein n=1 Tax=Luteimicrobium album TaxID=1054550 RepID=A0ABQ6I7D9_9MICO|nr:hypothetical protein GCM10025864_36270 [Luteimicrobium album]
MAELARDEERDLGTERLVTASADDVERAAEAALRPRRLDEFVGQHVVREQLSLVLEAATSRGAPPTTSSCRGRPGSARRRSP